MAKALVTREAVFEAADALAAAGDEPSMLIVQERIGAGSYTTIKRYLDIWKAERKTAAPAIAVPPDLTTRGQAFIQTVWASAATISEQRVAEVRATAEQQVRQATAALTAAEATIAHLEADADQALRELADLHRQLAEARTSGDAATPQRGWPTPVRPSRSSRSPTCGSRCYTSRVRWRRPAYLSPITPVSAASAPPCASSSTIRLR